MEDPGRSFAELADLQERSMRDAAAPTRES